MTEGELYFAAAAAVALAVTYVVGRWRGGRKPKRRAAKAERALKRLREYWAPATDAREVAAEAQRELRETERRTVDAQAEHRAKCDVLSKLRKDAVRSTENRIAAAEAEYQEKYEVLRKLREHVAMYEQADVSNTIS